MAPGDFGDADNYDLLLELDELESLLEEIEELEIEEAEASPAGPAELLRLPRELSDRMSALQAANVQELVLRIAALHAKLDVAEGSG